MNNRRIADSFDEVADLLDLTADNPFRIRAYRNAARMIRSYPEPLATLAENPTKKLSDLPGIGKDLESKIRCLLDTGKLPLLDHLRSVVPAKIRDLLRVPGLGPRKVMQLYQELGISSIEDLSAALDEHRVEQLKGFGIKTAAKISAGIDLLKNTSGRILLSEAKVIATALERHLYIPSILSRFAVAGSYRRQKETVGDLDLVVVCANPQNVMDRLASFDDVATIEARGPTRMTIRLKNGFQVDLRIVPDRSWGSALLYFTGSKSHNIALRQRALAKGLKLNEYGVFSRKRYLAGATEEIVYNELDLAWIPPELRETEKFIHLAERNKLPDLVECHNILGDLHVHTDFTDGRDSIIAMVDAAMHRGYKYLGLTDHSKRVTMVKGLDAIRAQKYWAEIDRVQSKYPTIKLLKGIELDILEDGKLDLPDKIVSQADWVIAALHYGQNQSRSEITKRLINAIKNPRVSAIAHPSGRLIGERSAYNADFNQVFKAAADYGCALEINGQPNRLDLNDNLLDLASKHSVAFVLNSDAHSMTELEFMDYALGQARRGGLEADRILNTRPWTDFIHIKA